MSKYKLAPVRWYMGQTLLPEHFVAQQNALLAEIRLRTAVQGLPTYGIAQLTWNEAAIAQGQIILTSLTAVLPDGSVLDIPGSGSVNALSLKATGASRATVFLHLLSDSGLAAGNELYADDPKILQRAMSKFQLSTEESLDRSVGALRLCAFENEAGKWHAAPDYIPPLLQVGNHPFLTRMLAELELALDAFRPQLATQLGDSFFRSDRLAVVRRCLTEVCTVQSVLADIKHGVHRHPYFLFEALRHLYFEVCCFNEVVPERPVLPYQHDQLGTCFNELWSLLRSKMRAHGGRETHLRLVKRDGLFTVAPLAPEVAKSQEIYLLIRRPQIHERVSLDGVKLAAPSRLGMVHRLALKGIPFRYLAQPPFNHSFGPDVDFYALSPGEEWEHALRESAVAFYITPALEKIDAFLYWRQG